MHSRVVSPDSGMREVTLLRFGIPALILAVYFLILSPPGRLTGDLVILFEEFWHFLPLEPLLADPLVSIWYLHAQPPVMNVVFWGVYALADALTVRPGAIATLLFSVVTVAIVYTWFELSLRFMRSIVWSAALVLLIIVNPGFAVHEQYFIYTHILILQSSLLLLAGHSWACCPSVKRSIVFALSLALLTYTWSGWHPLMIIGVTILTLINLLKRGTPFRRAVSISAIIFLVFAVTTVPWMVKNKILFGTASFSSWIGLNLSNGLELDDQSLAHYAWTGEYDPSLGEAYYGAQRWQNYLREPVLSITAKQGFPTEGYGIWYNLNHAVVPALSERSLREAIEFITTHPGSYARRCIRNITTFDLPSYYRIYSRNHVTGGYELMNDSVWAWMWDRLYYGGALRKYISLELYGVRVRPSFWIMLLLPVALIGAFVQIKRVGTVNGFISTLALFMYLWVLMVSIGIDGAEAARMRWPVEGMYLLLLFQSIASLGRMMLWKRKRKVAPFVRPRTGECLAVYPERPEKTR